VHACLVLHYAETYLSENEMFSHKQWFVFVMIIDSLAITEIVCGLDNPD
jgi:hypothetical protein